VQQNAASISRANTDLCEQILHEDRNIIILSDTANQLFIPFLDSCGKREESLKTGNKVSKQSGHNSSDEELIFEEYSSRKINWFPGHMNKAIRQILEGLKKVDIVLEIRDARSPLTTGNKALHTKMRGKSRLIVINKTNLAEPAIVELWKQWFEQQKEPFIFINCFDKGAMKKVVQLSKQVIDEKRGEERSSKSKMKMMIIGLPNTGKSTIINKLASRNATKVAAKPGQTQVQLWVKINNDLELLDTPGVMTPIIDNYEQGVWLSALHAIPDRIVTPEVPACYIVEHFVKKRSAIFKEHYKIEKFKDDLIESLNQIAVSRGCFMKKNEYDYERVYKLVLNDFRKGDLGPVSFGLPPRKKPSAKTD
jgi:ribosome biogenesis GTPase A